MAQLVVLTPEDLAGIISNATQQGAQKGIEWYSSTLPLNPEELLPLSTIAHRYNIHVATLRNRVNSRHIPTEPNPDNKKEQAVRRKHLDEILKNERKH